MVTIPKSVDDGMLLRIRGKGHQAMNGEFGDLILRVIVKPHPNFKRDGFNIHSEVRIPITKAIFGGSTNVETIHGSKQIIISSGT